MADEYQWLTTAPNPRASGAAISGGSAIGGWKLHAVKATLDETTRAIRFRKAACGLLPAHGWGSDLFIEDRCSRCVRTVGKVTRSG